MLFKPLSRRAGARPKILKKASITIGAFAIVLGALFASGHDTAADPGRGGDKNQGPIVETKEGPVEGLVSEGVSKFLGIPFAEPPVGELRWRPPVDHKPWKNVLKATHFAPICALVTTFGAFSGPANNNEDCLYLNVFTPKAKPGEKLPVLMWIYGGGNIDGETPGYDGSKLAGEGKTVVVTLAYRLNLMGFLAHPALDAEGHPFGNYAILDQQAVLKWIQRNIEKFGGDKNNVTVGGQSAGAFNTALNMLSPLAKGLFHRAICQSFCGLGGPSTARVSAPLPTRAQAEAKGIALAAAAGCGSGTGPDVAGCLRSLSSAQVEMLAGTTSSQSQFVVAGLVDGAIVPDQPGTLFSSGRFNHMPLMNGDVSDEQNFSLAIEEFFTNTVNGMRAPFTAQDYMNSIASFGAAAPRVMATYPLGSYKTPQLALDRIGTDSGICGQRRLDLVLAPQIPVYVYEFDDGTAPFYFPQMPGFQSLAYHTADIQYLFPGWHGGDQGIPHPLNRAQTKLSDQLVAAWSNFMRTGNPNGRGNAPWPRFIAADKGHTRLEKGHTWLIENIGHNSTLTDVEYSKLRHCDLWDSLVSD